MDGRKGRPQPFVVRNRQGYRAMEIMPQVIRTERLELRPWQLIDVDAVLAYAQDPEWSRYLHVLPIPYTRRSAEEFIARQVLLDPASHPTWAIVLDDVVVGGVNLRFQFDHRVADVGYSIARVHWNRGYVTEAATAVIDGGFQTYPELKRVRAFADARNTASQRVMEKLAMRREGILRQNRIERGVLVDEAWFGVLREEWESRGENGQTGSG